MLITKHSINQGIQRLNSKKGLILNPWQMRCKILRTISYGREIPIKTYNERHFQDPQTGLICVLVRDNIVTTTMFPDNRYKSKVANPEILVELGL